MEEKGLLIFTGIALAFGGLAVWISVRRMRRREQLLAEVAAAFDGGCVVEAKTGTQPSMKFRHQGAVARVRFVLEERNEGGMGERGDTELFVQLGKELRGFPVALSRRNAFLGIPSVGDLLHGRPVDLGDGKFKANYFLFSEDPQRAARFLSREVREQLYEIEDSRGRNELTIRDVERGLIVRVEGLLRERDRLLTFIEQGLFVFDAYRAACLELRPAPSGCPGCGGELSGEPVECVWCGAAHHCECIEPGGACGHCESVQPEEAAG